jgi:hypothetical protein
MGSVRAYLGVRESHGASSGGPSISRARPGWFSPVGGIPRRGLGDHREWASSVDDTGARGGSVPSAVAGATGPSEATSKRRKHGEEDDGRQGPSRLELAHMLR